MGNIGNRALVPLTALSCSLLLGGCAHERDVAVSPADVPRIVEQYGASAHVTVADEGQPLDVTPQSHPVLEVRHLCSVPELPDCKRLRAPLDSVRLEAGALRSSSPVDGEADPIPPEHVDEATLSLHPQRQATWDRTWGIGGAVAGAAGAAAVALHVLPQDWVALEVGLLPGFAGAEALGAYTAMRLRPIHFGFAAPFVGCFVNGLRLFSASGGRDEDEDGAGARLGFDFEHRPSHLIVSIEADLVHPLPGSDGYFGFHTAWAPWGGGAVTYFF